MKEIVGDIWSFNNSGNVIAITTNGIVKSDGCLVMGKGVALQASCNFPGIDEELGRLVTEYGNRPFYFSEYKLITLPTKKHYSDKSDIDLIKKSCRMLVRFADHWNLDVVYMVRPGCGSGGLKWDDVKKVIDTILDDRFIVVDKEDK